MPVLHYPLRRFAISTLCSLALSLAMPVHASESASAHSTSKATSTRSTSAETKPSWRELTPTQQQTLMPLAAEWNDLSTFRKKKWLELADRDAKMPPEAQARMQARIRDWAALSPEQRRKARHNYRNSKKLSPKQKAAQWERYQQLPEDKKKKLAASASNKKTIVNPPFLHNKKKTAPAPVLLDHHQTVLPEKNHADDASTDTSNEPESTSAP